MFIESGTLKSLCSYFVIVTVSITIFLNTRKVPGQVLSLPYVRSVNVMTVLGGGFGCRYLVVKNSELPGSGWGAEQGPLPPKHSPLSVWERRMGDSAHLTEPITNDSNMDGIIITLDGALRTPAKVAGMAVSPPCRLSLSLLNY